MPKKYVKVPVTVSALDLKISYYGLPYVQGQLLEVPLNLDIFTVKVVGQKHLIFIYELVAGQMKLSH